MSDKEKYVVFLGGPCIDEYYDIDEWPSEGNKFVCRYKGPVAGGMIANAACVMAGYGVKTYCFCEMSKGPETDFLLRDLQTHHVDTSKIILRENARDCKCLIFQGAKDRTISVVPGDPVRISLNDEQLDFLKGASYVYTALANMLDYEKPLELFKTLKESGVRIVLDNEASTYIDGWEEYMRYCYFASFNDYAMSVYGNGLNEDEFFKKILDLGVTVITETLGAEGCLIVTAQQRIRLGVYPVDVVDTTGAGDTFNTSFTYALSKEMELEQAGRFATAAANMCIRAQGPRSGITTEEKVHNFMLQHEMK